MTSPALTRHACPEGALVTELADTEQLAGVRFMSLQF
jgi:hypothetical protein